MADTILVTGAAGFAGGHLVELLAGSGASVAAWQRPGGHRGNIDSISRTAGTVTWHAVDLLEARQVDEAIAELRPSAVYHCAGAAHVGRSWDRATDTFATNVLGTHHLLEALRRVSSGARVVIPSSAMVYASLDGPLVETHPLRPASPYALSKLAQEMLGQHAIGNGLHVMVARAFNHLGPRQDPFFVAAGWARRIADIEAGRWEPEIAVGNLEARRDLTDVRDTVRAYRLILEAGVNGRAYNVCSGRAIAIRDLLEMMLARARVPIRVRHDQARYRPNDLPILLGDPGRIEAEIGWRPEISLDRTIDDLLAYWRSR